MYIESSAPRRAGDNARLTSPNLPSSTKSQCFTFWYHMYGRSIGSLYVSVQGSGSTSKVVWSEKVQQGRRWQLGQATISPQTAQYQVLYLEYRIKSTCYSFSC